MSWFKNVFELNIDKNYQYYNNQLLLKNEQYVSIGRFITPQLLHLREAGIKKIKQERIKQELQELQEINFIKYSNETDMIKIHNTSSGSNIQVFSRCNCLFGSFKNGINFLDEKYEKYKDYKSLIACATGTIYRYYLVPIVDNYGNLQIGQSSTVQLNNLDEFMLLLFNITKEYFFTICDGILLFNSEEKKIQLRNLLTSLNIEQIDRLRDSIKIGINQNVQVVCKNENGELFDDLKIVTQLICFNCYSDQKLGNFLNCYPLLQLILEANYEAILWATITYAPTVDIKNNHIIHLDGSIFYLFNHNDVTEIIIDAILRAIDKVEKYNTNLQIIIHFIDKNYEQKFNDKYDKYLSSGCEEFKINE